MIKFFKNYWRLFRKYGGVFSLLSMLLAILLITYGLLSSTIGFIVFGILILYVVFVALHEEERKIISVKTEKVINNVNEPRLNNSYFNFWRYYSLMLVVMTIILGFIENNREGQHGEFAGLYPGIFIIISIILLPFAALSYIGKWRLIINIIVTIILFFPIAMLLQLILQ